MAGIGFRLQKLLKGESYSDLLQAYFYSSLISTGPMLVIIICLFVLRSAVFATHGIEDSNFFMGIITYVFAFSLVISSPFLYLVTRYLADKHYAKQMEAYTPTYIGVLMVIFPIQLGVASLYLSSVPLPLSLKWTIACLYLFVTGIWIAMILLSAGRNYMWIVVAFNIGVLGGITIALLLGTRYGLPGFIMGFTIGQGLTFLILTVRIFLEFGYEQKPDFGFLSYFSKYPSLALIGLFYYLGVWVDKLLFWYYRGEELAPGIHMFPDYDTPIFIAFVTIVPSMAFFLIQMETSFALRYHAYYQSIRNRESLNRIRERKKGIVDNLSTNFQVFVVFQGIISSLVILFIYDIAEMVRLNQFQLGIMRIGILGAYLQMGFLMIIIVLFYFDFKTDVFRLSFLFFLCNAVFTWITIQLGFAAYGFGYAGACFVAVTAGFIILDKKLRDLNYWTYMRQPIAIPKFRLENEA